MHPWQAAKAAPTAHTAQPWARLKLPHFRLSAMGSEGQAAAAPAAKLEVNFSGKWHKDDFGGGGAHSAKNNALRVEGDRSTPMTDALRVMHIGGLLRQAIKLVRGCNITQTDDEFVMDITSVIGWFKVRERFKLNGDVSTNRRRDWRGGGTRGTLKAVAPDRLQLRLEFDDPHGGVNVDEFHMPNENELHVSTVITTTGGETAKFTQVYTRRE